MHKKSLLLLIFLFSQVVLFAQNIIPFPTYFAYSETEVNIDAIHSISISDEVLRSDADVFNQYLQNINGKILLTKPASNGTIILQLDKLAKPEAYTLKTLTNDNIVIKGSESGIFYGLMTLLQLITNPASKIIDENIQDEPSFPWRGMHLDVCRHFFPIAFVKKYIDILALHKMNTFHWHLTDDQGWRIEIKKYPLLTSIGSKRKETMVDKHFDPYIGDQIPVEGFYTQIEIKEVIDYAAARHITIVPEIEMPGHAVAALTAYPQFACKDSIVDVMTTWGVSSNVFCTKDVTIHFLEDILDEVIALFPSKYIHIGGDEVPKENWKSCAACQKNIKENHLKNEHQLQSYFIKKIDAYITSKGRNTIGWDEILEGGLAPNATVMSWRGEEGGIAAAKQKHSVVMTPGSYCYFDHYQGKKATEPLAIGGFTTVEKVYGYQPIPALLPKQNRKYILGAQGNVWTEYIPNSDHVEYMAVPRLCALAEVLWTGDKRKDYGDFAKRLITHFSFLEKNKINYAKNIFDVEIKSNISANGLQLSLHNALSNYTIKYTIDTTLSEADWKTADSTPISIRQSTNMKAALFNDKGEKMGAVVSQNYVVNLATGKKVNNKPAASSYYNHGGNTTLVDGIIGTLPWTGSEWLGWSGKNVETILDLGTKTTVHSVSMHYLSDEASWIYLPQQIELWVSIDGKQYIQKGKITEKDILLLENGSSPVFQFEPLSTRFVKLVSTCIQKIPAGKPGATENAWLFMSELVVE